MLFVPGKGKYTEDSSFYCLFFVANSKSSDIKDSFQVEK